MEHKLKAKIQIIGINPHVLLPEYILTSLFEQAGKDKGPIQIKGKINGKAYIQTLVKYSGAWRLYINLKMLTDSPKRIGEVIELTVAFDPKKRVLPQHPQLIKALKENQIANTIFINLRPSLQQEIVRYISNLKTKESIDRNIEKAILFLLGKGRFIGRDKP